MLECLEVETGPGAKAAVVWLHGLGADGHDFEPLVPQLRLSCPVRFVFPHAPPRPVTINRGAVMRAWYDILIAERGAAEDGEGVRASAREVAGLLDREQDRGVEPARLVLAGFSQGGAVALHLALRYPQRLAGVLALSTYLPLSATLPREADPANAGLNVFMAHGRADPVIPLELAEASRDRLTALGYAVHWHSYAVAHGLHPREVDDISSWLDGVLCA